MSAIVVSNPTAPQTGLFPDIFSAYSRLSSHPIAITIFIIAVISLVAESNNQNGPLEILSKSLADYVDPKNKHPDILVTLATVLKSFIDALIKIKKFFFLWLLILVIPIVYSDRDTSLLVIFLFIYTVITSHSYIVLFFIIQAFFVYYSLQDFSSRIILFILIVYLVFGTENIQKIFTPLKDGNGRI